MDIKKHDTMFKHKVTNILEGIQSIFNLWTFKVHLLKMLHFCFLEKFV